MRKLLFLVAVLATTTFLISSCSKDKDDDVKIGSKIQYKLIGSSNVTLHNLSYTDGNGQTISVGDIGNSNWTSPEITQNKANGTLVLAGGGWTTNDASGEIKAQIIINGNVVQETVNTGTTIAAVVYHEF